MVYHSILCPIPNFDTIKGEIDVYRTDAYSALKTFSPEKVAARRADG